MNVKFFIGNLKNVNKFFPNKLDATTYLFFIYGFIKKEIQLLIKFNYGYLKIRVRDNKSDAFILGEVMMQDCYDISKFTNLDCKTILDLGANCGYTSIYLAKKYPNSKIVAVEPIPTNIKQIETHIKLNNLADTITLFPYAIGAVDGSAYLHYIDKDYGHQVKDIPSENKIDVVSVNTIMQKMKWSSIDFLKIDIEGYEDVLLKNNTDWLTKVKNIVIEIHDNYTFDDLCTLAKNYNFLPAQDIHGNYFLTKNI